MGEAFLDDKIVIPDDIKKMSKEELEKAIAELEVEVKRRS